MFKILLSAVVSIMCCHAAWSQQSNLQSQRPILFTTPASLPWETNEIKSLDYNVEGIPGGASLYELPSAKALRFSISLVFSKSQFSIPIQQRATFSAMSDIIATGGFANKTVEQIQKFLSNNGISLQSNVNKAGQLVVNIAALTSDFDLALNLLRELVFKPDFNPNALTLWKQDRINFYQNLIDANSVGKQMYFVNLQANKLAFGEDNSLSQSFHYSSPSEINKVTIEGVKSVWENLYNKNGLNAFLVGKYSSQQLMKLKLFLNSLKETKPPILSWLPQRSLQQNSNHKISTVIIKKSDMTQCNVTLRYYFNNLGSRNEIEKLDYLIISDTFSTGGGIVGNDRFSSVMRAKSGISYAPHANFNFNIIYPNTNISGFYLNFQTPNERLAEAVTLAKSTWETYLDKGMQQHELDFTKASLSNRLLGMENTSFDKMDEIMDDVMHNIIPRRNAIQSTLVKLQNLPNLDRINQKLHELQNSNPLPVLVILGNPNEKDIAELLKDPKIDLIRTIDFNSIINSN